MTKDHHDRLVQLFELYVHNLTSPLQEKELASLIKNADREILEKLLKKHWERPQKKLPVFDKNEARSILDEILAGEHKTRHLPVRNRKTWPRVAAAAAVLMILGAGAYLLLPGRVMDEKPIADSIASPEQVPPGGNKALLILGDGSTVVLDSEEKGLIAQETGSDIHKVEDGKLVYEADPDEVEEAVFNTLSTPRGGTFRVQLPDGSMAYLNASSSISFPVSFAGDVRKVEISGEVFFEVAVNPSMPFTVKVNDLTVTALGTSFNIMAYPDEEALKTTLVEGLAMVQTDESDILLNPGQQISIWEEGIHAVTTDVDIDEVLAWKNGYFLFSNKDIKSIMKQISRWYDLDIAYEEGYSGETYSGIVSKNSNLSEVLMIMERAGVNFKLEDNVLKVKS